MHSLNMDAEPAGSVGRIAAWALSIGIAAWIIFLFVSDWQRIQQRGPVALQLQAFLPENGGWVGQPLRVESGRSAVLNIETAEGAHAFAIAHTDVRSPVLTPGTDASIQFTAPPPGKYVLYCTVWCSPNHWRMRTVLEVTDPGDPKASLAYFSERQRYDIPIEGLSLDEPHPASSWPRQRGNAFRGEAVWQTLSSSPTGQNPDLDVGWPLVAPDSLFEQLRFNDASGLLVSSSPAEQDIWDLIAYLWRERTNDEALALGASLYKENCAACHGPDGGGDGPYASFTPGEEPNLRNPANAYGASPARYYAKIGRGGMGTGMPNWGTIFDENEMWSLVDTLYSFAFDYKTTESNQ
jgi:hypothetical protein